MKFLCTAFLHLFLVLDEDGTPSLDVKKKFYFKILNVYKCLNPVTAAAVSVHGSVSSMNWARITHQEGFILKFKSFKF